MKEHYQFCNIAFMTLANIPTSFAIYDILSKIAVIRGNIALRIWHFLKYFNAIRKKMEILSKNAIK